MKVLGYLTLAFLACSAQQIVTTNSAAGLLENKCCIDQPAPKHVVEKVAVQTLYRSITQSRRYSVDCGLFGWGSCTRYSQYTRRQSYNVDVYQLKSYPQPCRKYACCQGYTMVKDLCYADGELGQAVNNVADIKDALAGVGGVDLKDILGGIHDIIGATADDKSTSNPNDVV